MTARAWGRPRWAQRRGAAVKWTPSQGQAHLQGQRLHRRVWALERRVLGTDTFLGEEVLWLLAMLCSGESEPCHVAWGKM